MGGQRNLIVFAAVATLIVWVVGSAIADDHERQRRRHREREHQQQRSDNAVPAADNPTYQEVCGACHFPLQPALLPSRSWQRLLGGTQDHFGQSLGLEAGQLKELEAYLTTNAAERTSSELAQDILDSIGSSTPMRVTDLPEIRGEHRRLDDTVFRRPSVAGRANCPACHPGAARGVYDDDTVTIPSS